jgi:diguanylate cyclase (GGDEF)-like protein
VSAAEDALREAGRLPAAQPGPSTAGRGTPVSPDVLLSEIAQLLLSESAPNLVFEAVADALSQLVPHDTLSLYQADNPLRVLRPVLVRDAFVDEILAMGPIAYGAGITGMTAEARSAALVNDAHLDPRAKQIPDTPEEPESFIAVSLVAREELVGVLCLTRLGDDHHFSEEEFRLVQSFSGMAALAIDNARIRARLEAEVVTDHLTALYNHRYFHERLSTELRKANMRHRSVGLIVLDIDDFGRVNDGYGHVVGDQILQGIASLVREAASESDAACRVGGEEFALILPGLELDAVQEVAERLRQGIGDVEFPEAGFVTVSAGVVAGPQDAPSPRELIGAAYQALRRAKADGKNCSRTVDAARAGAPAVTLDDELIGLAAASPAGPRHESQFDGVTPAGDFRSVAQLKMLQSLSNRLNRLNDVSAIGETITAELRSLIDYHNCRVHVMSPDGRMLIPVAFRGELSEYQGETFDALLTRVGEGITGRVAENGESIYTPDANDCEFAVTIPGTDDVDESILCVPMSYGDRIMGTVTLSKLGLDQFDRDDLRALEALASTAAIAVENARLLGQVRESAEVSEGLLELAKSVTGENDADLIYRQALAAVRSLLACEIATIWVRDPESQMFAQAAHQGLTPESVEQLSAGRVDGDLAMSLLGSIDEPFVLPGGAVANLPEELAAFDPRFDLLVAPLRWQPEGLGALVIVPPNADHQFGERDLRLAGGIGDVTSLALASAGSYEELERAYLSTIEALANALEAKDEYTSDHARALAEMSLSVGAEMGIQGERLKRLELGALFHDIGKIGVPSEIIRKPGALTAAERKLMNLHPEIGEEILAPVPFLQPIRPIVRACHERWDGGGYPDRLQRDGIPVEARIIFVCDAYHAMTSDRPYRNAMPAPDAIKRLQTASGTQFDPDVVAAFVRCFERGEIDRGHAH